MKNILCLFLTFVVCPYFCFAQSNTSDEFSYEVHVVDPPFAISKTTVESANTLLDINKYYKPDWVKAYESVEISATEQGEIKRVYGKSGQLTDEQKALLNKADANTAIKVKIVYLPENNLKQNDLKEHKFSFKILPETEATFIGSNQELKQYLKQNAVDKIPAGTLRQYALAAVKFTIDEAGKITNSSIFESTKDEKIDAILLETIANMPNWKPAEFASGLKVKQEFVFTVGDMRSCVVNLLNIR